MNKLLAISLFIFCTHAKAQQPLTLISYIDSVLAHNPQIKQQELALKKSEYDYRQSLWSHTPEISAQFNINKIYGTAFDNVTFQRIQRATTNAFPSLNLSMTLFNGFEKIFQNRYTYYQREAGKYAVETEKYNQVLAAMQAYVGLMVAQKSSALFARRAGTLQKLLALKRIEQENGAVSQATYLAVLAQYEQERANYTDARNQQAIAIRNLYFLMGRPADTSITLNPELPAETNGGLTVQNIRYYEARNRQRHARMMAQKNYSLSVLSDFSPKVYLNASIASSYSSNGIFDYNTGEISYPGYGPQFGQNAYQFIGLTLDVPLFKSMQRSYRYRKSKVDIAIQELTNHTQKLEDDNNLLNLQGTYASLQQQKSMLSTAAEAAGLSLKEQEAKFKQGQTDIYTYMLALDNYSSAELNLFKNEVERMVTQAQLSLYANP